MLFLSVKHSTDKKDSCIFIITLITARCLDTQSFTTAAAAATATATSTTTATTATTTAFRPSLQWDKFPILTL